MVFGVSGGPRYQQVDDGLRGERSSAARSYFDAGQAAHPELVLEYEAFEHYFTRHAETVRAHAPDMYLACACAEGVEGALEILERTLRSDVARALASIDRSPSFVEDVLQATREKLLVPKAGAPARITTYAGRASLKSWLCAVAVRTAVSLRRRKSELPPRGTEAGADEPIARGGPELEYLRRRYKESFEDSVRSAIAALSAKDRMLLRLNVIDGLSVDQLGAVYKVGRSTAARWLATARRSLVDGARCELQRRLGVGSRELESLADDLRSQLDASVLKLLRTAQD
jgi:RNA polymerase sigma-70 factor (ECF subfamily)